MRFDHMPPALPEEGDSPKFVEALNKLMIGGAHPRRPPNNHHQIKVSSDISFYPDKGTIYRDGDKKPLAERGVEALLELLGKAGLLTISVQV